MSAGSKAMAKAAFWDWTERDGISNTSSLHKKLKREIEEIIRDSAHRLISGHADHVAETIVAHLAHKFKFIPSDETNL